MKEQSQSNKTYHDSVRAGINISNLNASEESLLSKGLNSTKTISHVLYLEIIFPVEGVALKIMKVQVDELR